MELGLEGARAAFGVEDRWVAVVEPEGAFEELPAAEAGVLGVVGVAVCGDEVDVGGLRCVGVLVKLWVEMGRGLCVQF